MHLERVKILGNREDLLAGARRCLYEKGYARTTARDIAAASGVSLAGIGYHFGSTEALLNAAMLQAIEEWGERIGEVLAADFDPSRSPLERFAASWTRVMETFETYRPLWVATFEVLGQAEHVPEIKAFLAEALNQGRLGLARLFQGIDEEKDPQTAWLVGSLYQALMSGLAVQWAVDPARTPSGMDLAEALRLILAGEPEAGE